MSKTLADAADALSQGLPRIPLQRLITTATDRASEIVSSHTPYRAGKLRRATKREVISSELRGRVFNDSPIAGFVHDGTRPHVIRARSGGVLAFRVNGKQVFARSVNHPGTKAQPWFDTSSTDVQAMLESLVGELGDDVAAEVFK